MWVRLNAGKLTSKHDSPEKMLWQLRSCGDGGRGKAGDQTNSEDNCQVWVTSAHGGEREGSVKAFRLMQQDGQ